MPREREGSTFERTLERRRRQHSSWKEGRVDEGERVQQQQPDGCDGKKLQQCGVLPTRTCRGLRASQGSRVGARSGTGMYLFFDRGSFGLTGEDPCCGSSLKFLAPEWMTIAVEPAGSGKARGLGQSLPEP